MQIHSNRSQMICMPPRRGFSLIELVTVFAIFAVLLGILIPAMERSREAARLNACRDNFRQLGVALAAYHDTHGIFPPTNLDPATFDAPISPLAALLPYVSADQNPPKNDPAVHWSHQQADVAKTVVPLFLCPSRQHPDVVKSPELELLNLPVGSEFATCDYIFSKGPNDSWCSPEGPHTFKPMPDKERGAFGLGQFTGLKDITDGHDTTFVMGEGVAGPRWLTSARQNPLFPHQSRATGAVFESYNFWIFPRIITTRDQSTTDVVITSLYGSTAPMLNSRQIVETLADTSALDDCRSSEFGGPHRVSGFRSEHRAGGLFLFADGSVRFLHEQLDLHLYEAFSTIRGEEKIYFGN